MPSSTSSSDSISARRRQYDERLISMERKPQDWRFLSLIGATAMSCFILWSFTVPHLPKYVPTLNQSENNRQIIMDFERDNEPAFTLAGTSLAYRLYPQLFSVATSNASLPGESSVSSAAVASEKNPKVLVIEVNILDRPRNHELERFAAGLISPPLGIEALNFAYSPVRSGVSLAYKLDAVVDRQAIASARDAQKLVEQPPQLLNSGETVSEAARALNRRPVTGLISQSAQELRSIADQVEAHGGQVFYLMMPMHPLIAATDYESRGSATMLAADPKFANRLLRIDWSDELRWDPDGAHLDARSAAIAARQLEQAIRRQAR
jgi:hypothetical protein